MALAAVFATGMAVLSLFIYWQTVGYLTRRVDTELLDNAQAIVRATPAARVERIQRYLESDVPLLKIAGLFDGAGRPLAGNLQSVPAGLGDQGPVSEIDIPVTGTRRGETQSVRAVALPIPGEGRVVLGRSVRAVDEINAIVKRALLLAIVPTIVLALLAGLALSRSAVSRIAAVHRTSRLIMAGQMGERLPIGGRNDDFDNLARIVNEMLDEIERLMAEAKGVGEDIAHDLRTPLTRLRGRLERAVAATLPADDKRHLEMAIDDVDQILGTIAALMRIAEVEHGRRRAGFRDVDLGDVVQEAADLYDPIAEEKGISLTVRNGRMPLVRGDGDLLFEAVANLIDNAVKFARPKGHVEVSLQLRSEGPVIRVADDGPGIRRADFPNVLRRFNRGDRSRNTPGSGLGLSLVSAVARLHGYALVLNESGQGCCLEMECWHHEMPGAGDRVPGV